MSQYRTSGTLEANEKARIADAMAARVSDGAAGGMPPEPLALTETAAAVVLATADQSSLTLHCVFWRIAWLLSRTSLTYLLSSV
jgi:hypothetical protein